MLMDIVWIGVMGAGTRAKAAAFMYSEVVATDRQLVPRWGLRDAGGERSREEECQLCGPGREPLPGV